ncbi:unnamed protein product [Prorocentrum cordatum]|uniref:Sister chromatid cohesion DCC1 n=1 Tax=Prorocentrum cordatum TaxID=2364126 RepID=A0ABN9PGB4_9DINO|nr:unnamed protein product [Polarella glacialis]
MAALEKEKPLATSFGPEFVCTDQDVADLKAGLPPPETKWCLVELPKEELAALEAGSRFYFHEFSGATRGNDGGQAALCTESGTYSLEFLENSNSLMIGALSTTSDAGPAPGGGAEVRPQGGGGDGPEAGAPAPAPQPPQTIFGTCQVFAQCRGQLTMKGVSPDMGKLRELLSKHRLGEPADSLDGAPAAQGETIDSLEFQVAAAPSQLKKALQDGPYAEHNGRWFLLPPALEREIVDAAVELVAASGWSLEAVDGESLLKEVQQHLKVKTTVPSVGVLRKALKSVLSEEPAAPAEAKVDGASDSAPRPDAPNATPNAEDAGAGGCRPLRFDKQKVDISKALRLLREPPARVRERFQLPLPSRAKRARVAGAPRGAGGGHQADALKVTEFAKAFQELTGSDADADAVLKLLGNAAYVDEIEGTLSAMDADSLSRDPFERLKQLFAIQTHWRPDRLAALVAPALPAGVKVDAWLLKWTRAVYLDLGEPPTEQRMLTKKFGGL